MCGFVGNEDRADGVQTERLLDHRLQVRQPRDVRLLHEPLLADNCVELRLQPLEDAGVAQKLAHRPLHRHGGCVGAACEHVLGRQGNETTCTRVN